ncbi:unnamed protein product [Psylliodes chrysocephalus]|uniref:Uncharacterized protein n=1 Tax=Psylliodes chrysocephalus TaxID=3402493 RepID=A0A9P0D8Z2_9CUCU|nr:unnamed protein product [Psylliodes chrysocephala]
MYLHIKINTYMGQFLDCFQVSFVSLKKVSNIIKQDVIIIQTVCVLMFIIGLLVHLNCLLLNVFNAKESIYYPAAYLENKYVMILLLLPQWFMMTYEELYIVWAVFYFAIHLKFQLDALTRYLKEKIIDLQVDERICMEDKHYQDIVYRRLRFCAQRHVKLKQIFEETACKVASAALLLSIFTGSLCVIAALYFILNNVNPKFNSIMYGVLINATLYHYSGNYYGQKIIDAIYPLISIGQLGEE